VSQRPEFLNVFAIVVGVVALAIGGPWLFGQIRSLPKATALAARADQRIVTLEVGGMTCQGCAASVQSKLVAVPGVASAAVRFAQRRAYFVCEKDVADTALVAALHRAGPGFLADVTTR
jgi:copper chaperone CopZ